MARFVFSGYAVGASANFHRLDDVRNLNLSIPIPAASALASSGGRSVQHAADFVYAVDEPRPRTLLSVKTVETTAQGWEIHNCFETEVACLVRGVSVVEKLHVDVVALRQTATHAKNAEPVVQVSVAKIEGLRLANVAVAVELDTQPFDHHCDKGAILSTLVKNIELAGPPEELNTIKIDGNMIVWSGFGRIFLGELIIDGHDRQVTMIRLEMGSDAGGQGVIGQAGTSSRFLISDDPSGRVAQAGPHGPGGGRPGGGPI